MLLISYIFEALRSLSAYRNSYIWRSFFCFTCYCVVTAGCSSFAWKLEVPWTCGTAVQYFTCMYMYRESIEAFLFQNSLVGSANAYSNFAWPIWFDNGGGGGNGEKVHYFQNIIYIRSINFKDEYVCADVELDFIFVSVSNCNAWGRGHICTEIVIYYTCFGWQVRRMLQYLMKGMNNSVYSCDLFLKIGRASAASKLEKNWFSVPVWWQILADVQY